MDDAHNLLGQGEVDEITHREPNVMAGYFKGPEPAAARRFGWHHTDDLGQPKCQRRHEWKMT
jgi:long-chain acyl-CoA synthetase